MSQGNLLDNLGGLSTNQTPSQPIISNGTGKNAHGIIYKFMCRDCLAVKRHLTLMKYPYNLPDAHFLLPFLRS